MKTPVSIKLKRPLFFRVFLVTVALLLISSMWRPNVVTVRAANGVPRPDHVVWVLFENHAYNQVIGAGVAPYFDSLAAAGANMTAAHAVTHPSEPNYAAFFSGAIQGISGDPCPAPGAPFTTPNLGAQLIAAGHTIKSYSENLPSVGYTGCDSNGYVYKHNPYVFWQGSGTNQLPASGNMPLSAWPTDFSTLPTLSIVVPTLCNDMHDCSVATGDTWLKNHLDAYKTWAMTHNSLLIVDFDEDNGSAGNQIPTIFVGSMVAPGNYSQNINHYSVLRTIEDMYNLPYAGAAASATTITGIWRSTSPTATPCVCPTRTQIPAGVNLVPNPSFESQGSGGVADAANWAEGGQHVRANDKVHSGSWALHSTFRTGGTDTRTTSPIAVSPNTTYNYSVYIWKTNAAGYAYADMNDIAGETTLISSTTGNWQFLTGTWNSGSNTSVTLRAVTDGSPTGDIWFDDISLAVAGGPVPPIVTPTPGRTSTPTPVVSTSISFQYGVLPTSGYAGMIDTMIHEGSPTVNFGNATTLEVDGDEAGMDKSILLKWDISSIPAGKTVTNASLVFSVIDASIDSYQVYQVKRNWVESQATWNIFSSGNNWQTAGAFGANDRGATVLGTAGPAAAGAGYTIPLNGAGIALVQSWVNNPATNLGLVIANATSVDGLDFNSSEAATASTHPKLVIIYH